jgi:spore maturation protein CgeB
VRVLAVHPGPAFSVADVYSGWLDALRTLGVQVEEYNLDARLTFYTSALLETDHHSATGQVMLRKALPYEQAIGLALNGIMAACYRLWPDVLLIVSGLFVDEQMLDTIRSRGTRVVIIHTEEPYEHDRQVELAARADVNLVNDPVLLGDYRQVCPASYYVPHAYRPDRHHPRDPVPDLASDFCFVGTGYPSRVAFLEQVDWSGLHVRLAGNWAGLGEESPLWPLLVGDDPGFCMDNADAAGLYASTAMSANLYRREADRPELVAGWAMGPREVELAAMGVFHLRDPRGEGDEVLPMLPTFAGPDDFGEQVRWWLSRPADRAEAATKARAAVADRTFEANARMLLRLLGA